MSIMLLHETIPQEKVFGLNS